jgi:hypothetical protein
MGGLSNPKDEKRGTYKLYLGVGKDSRKVPIIGRTEANGTSISIRPGTNPTFSSDRRSQGRTEQTQPDECNFTGTV